MKHTLLITCAFFLCFTATFAQRSQSTAKRILINTKRPAVFVSFIEQRSIKTEKPSPQKFLFFRITNNTRWKIWLDMSGTAGKEFGETRLYYAIEERKTGTNISGTVSCHVCSNNPLGPGRSIIFSIPADDASLETRMRLVYRFDWDDDRDFGGSTTTHSVEYYFHYLPVKMLNP
jgi:hypothetical protein